MKRYYLGPVIVSVMFASALSACASSSDHTLVSGRTEHAALPTKHAVARYQVGADAITSPIDLSGGGIVLSPPGPGATSVTSASEALSAVQSSDLYFSLLGTLPSSGMKFAVMTDSGYGPQPTDGASFTPTFVDRPVWFIEYSDVPYEPSGPAPSTSSPSSSSQPTTDQWLVVDDNSDTVVMSLLGLPGHYTGSESSSSRTAGA
jgi:hypothetical protein